MKSLPLIIVLLTGILAPAEAQTIWSDNFNSDAAGALTTADTNWHGVTPGTGGTAIVTQDAANSFGQGTTNQYLALNETGTNTAVSIVSSAFSSSVLSGEFDLSFYQPTGTYSGQGYIIRIGDSTGMSNGAAAFAVDVQNGTIQAATGTSVNPTGTTLATYNSNTLNTLNVVFNNSSSNYAYAGGTIASGDMDIWLDGSLIAHNVTGANNGTLIGTSLDAFDFTAKNSLTSTLDVDNVVVQSVATVPEPSTVVLFLFGVAVMFFPLLRRRNC